MEQKKYERILYVELAGIAKGAKPLVCDAHFKGLADVTLFAKTS